MTSVFSVSCSEALMVVLRSDAKPMSTLAGKAARNWMRDSFTALTVAMILAPGCR